MVKTAAQMVGEAKAAIEIVPPAAAADELASGAPVLLDVREPVEWENRLPEIVQATLAVPPCLSPELLRMGFEPLDLTRQARVLLHHLIALPLPGVVVGPHPRSLSLYLLRFGPSGSHQPLESCQLSAEG